jgi:Short C-terminal domain
VIAGMATFGIHELSKQTAEEFPGANFSDTFGEPRDRFVAAVKGANLGERASKLREGLPEVKRPEVRLPDVRRPGGGGDGDADRAQGGGGATGGEGPAPTEEAPTRVLDDQDAFLARLERLGDLRDRGVLTDEEFAAEKARLLSRQQP